MRRLASIHTSRLRVRPYRENDLDALHALWTDPQVRRYLWDDRVIERTLAAEVMRGSIASTAAEGFGHWAVCPTGGDALIGFCGLRRLDDGPDVELLYGLAPAYWHRGLATEAARAMLRFGFGQLGFARIFALTDAPNTASVAVMQRLGMSFECRLIYHGLDTVQYIMRRDAFTVPDEPFLVHYAESRGREEAR